MAGQVVARHGQFGSDGSALATMLALGQEQRTDVGGITWQPPSLSPSRGEVKKGRGFFKAKG